MARTAEATRWIAGTPTASEEARQALRTAVHLVDAGARTCEVSGCRLGCARGAEARVELVHVVHVDNNLR